MDIDFGTSPVAKPVGQPEYRIRDGDILFFVLATFVCPHVAAAEPQWYARSGVSKTNFSVGQIRTNKVTRGPHYDA